MFREEVIQNQRYNTLGSIQIANRTTHGVLVGIAFLIGSAILVFCYVSHLTLRTPVTGLTVPVGGLIETRATGPGIITEIHVAEGQRIAKGALIATIRAARSSQLGNTADLVRQNINTQQIALRDEIQNRIKIAQERARSNDHDVEGLQGRLVQAEQQETLLAESVALIQESHESFIRLRENGFLSQAQLQLKKRELIEAQTKVVGVRRDIAEIQAQLLLRKDEKRQISLQSAADVAQLARLSSSLAEAGMQAEDNRLQLVTAPASGTVGSLSARLGNTVSVGQVMAVIVPEGKQSTGMLAQFEVPGRLSGTVAEGQRVWVRFPAFPFQKFGMVSGIVRHVSSAPLRVDEQNGQVREPVFRIDVSLAAQEVSSGEKTYKLHPGMQCEADIVRDRRAVWELALEPLLAARARQRIQ